MVDNPLDHLRAICLAYPEAVEDMDGVGSPAYKVRGKIFAMHHPMQNRASLWCKAPPGLQRALVETDSSRFFVPPYVGIHGWVGIWLDVAQDWAHIADLIADSYRMTAPKRLVAMLDQTRRNP